MDRQVIRKAAAFNAAEVLMQDRTEKKSRNPRRRRIFTIKGRAGVLEAIACGAIINQGRVRANIFIYLS